jgi:hypothetical protein
MPSPWLLALRAIPWATLLAEPALAKAAGRFRAKAREAEDAEADDLASLRARVAALEDQVRTQVDVLAQVTDQITALTTATEVLAARLRWLLVLGLGAIGLAIVALVLLLAGR